MASSLDMKRPVLRPDDAQSVQDRAQSRDVQAGVRHLAQRHLVLADEEDPMDPQQPHVRDAQAVEVPGQQPKPHAQYRDSHHGQADAGVKPQGYPRARREQQDSSDPPWHHSNGVGLRLPQQLLVLDEGLVDTLDREHASVEPCHGCVIGIIGRAPDSPKADQ